MALFKARTDFKLGETGWSESIYLDLPSISAMVSSWSAYQALRRALMPPDVLMTGGALSDDEVFRDSQGLSQPGLPLKGTYGGSVANGDVLPPEVGLDIRLETPKPAGLAVSLHRRIFPLRGLPKIVAQGPAFVPNSTFNAALTAWQNHLKSGTNGWALKVRTLDAGPINTYTVDATGLLTLPTESVPIIPDTIQWIQFRRPSGVVPSATRPFFIRTISNPDILPQTILLRGWAPRKTMSDTLAPGSFVTAFHYVLEDIDAAIVDELGQHKVGRPRGLQRGRRSRAK